MNNYIYYLILDNSVKSLEETFFPKQELNYISKHSTKLLNTLKNKPNKFKLDIIDKVKQIDEKARTLALSHEMVVYMCLDHLKNNIRDTLARNRFTLIDTNDRLQRLEVHYQKNLREHYKFFFEDIVGVLER